jgi:hypothetical protein
VAVGILRDDWSSPVDLLDVSQAGLDLESGGMGALLFSQGNMVCRSFLWAGGSGVNVLILLGALFLPSVAPSSQQDF